MIKYNIIRDLRLKNNMSGQELANKLGVAVSTIYMWEKGQRSINYKYIPILCSIFNIDKSILYNELSPRLSFNTNTVKVDEYLKNKLNTVDSRYIVIDMKDLKIDIVKEKADLNKNIAPLEKVDTLTIDKQEDIAPIIDEIISNFKK